MGILDAEQTDSGVSVVLGRHGSSTPVMGAGAGPDTTAVATIHGDGVVVYDCDAQTKTRSWAVGRGHAFAAPAVFDRGCGRYFAALLPPGETDPALVTWTDADPIASLDQAVDASSTRLPDGIAALVAVGEGNDDGGVIVVDVGGGARWFGADARKLAASAPPGEGGGVDAEKKKKKTGSASAKRVAETCGEANGGGGVVVVTADRSNADVRTVTLYEVTGGEHGGRSVKTAWEFEASVPEGASRAVAVAGGTDDACVMWSNGVWRAYTSHNDESRMRTLVTAGGANETPGAAGKRAGGKRGAAIKVDNNFAVLPAASMASLGGGFYAVAQVGPGCGGGARIAVFDSKYGCVHSCTETHPGSSGGGDAAGGVRIAALPGVDGDGDPRLVVAIAGEVAMAQVSVPGPTVTLLDVLGRLNLAAGPDGPAGPAIKVLGMANAREASKPPQYSIYAPKFPAPTPRPTDPHAPPLDGIIDLGDPVENGWWGPDPAAEKMAEDVVNKFHGDEPLTAGEAAEMLDRYKTDEHVDVPPAVLAAGIEGCLRRQLWAPLRALVDEGYLTHSCQAPGLASTLIAAGRFADLDAFLRLGDDVDGADIRACLEVFLDENSQVPVKAIEEVSARQVKFATDAVARAERLTSAARTAKERHALSAASTAKAALHRARIATAAVEAFDGMPRAPLLHALCARPLCPEYATAALPDLPPASAARLVRYLSVWLEAYSGFGAAGSGPIDGGGDDEPSLFGIPALREVVAWAGAVIDAHFTAFAMNSTAGGDEEQHEATATLRRAAARLQAGCASVGRVNGALVHVRDGAPLPENQGVQSSTYSIELVDW
mmetsp:Transcript_6778/g.26400  ORF Transcript_6778/g.26400 Transcript_6778/m.26400 type:complete len:831 (-) Transcript_6778:40-2532(-)